MCACPKVRNMSETTKRVLQIVADSNDIVMSDAMFAAHEEHDYLHQLEADIGGEGGDT